MMSLPSVLLVVLQLCSLQVMVTSRPTCRLPGHLVVSAYRLLHDLGGDFPPQCLASSGNFSFPDSAFPVATPGHTQCPMALWVVYESLEQTWNIFDNQSSPVGEGGVTWDEQKLERFQSIQDELLDEGSCLKGVGPSAILSPYFMNVTSFLEQQDNAACGWMALKSDLQAVLITAVEKHHSCFIWKKGH